MIWRPSRTGLRATLYALSRHLTVFREDDTMIQLLWALSTRIRYYLRCYAPTNIALDAIRTRRGLKWGIPAMLLAAPYLLIANYCVTVITDDGPGWLNLVVLLCCWNALKLLIMGPVGVVLLIRARVQEALARDRTRGRLVSTEPVQATAADSVS